MKDEPLVKDKMELEDIDVNSLCTEIKKHAAQARNEEELKIKIESTLRPILEKWDIKWASYNHSHKISGVRKDALYGTVIVEYKAPQNLDSRRDFERGKQQVKKYISEEAGDPQYFGRYFGILLDGYKIAFIRYRKNEWEEPDLPLEISPRTVLRALEAMRGLKRKPIDAEELLKDFGPKSEISEKLILKLYDSISTSTSSRSLMLFEDWKRVFSKVCAYSKDKMAGLIDHYGLERKKNVDVEKLMFSVHTYYTLQMKLLTSEIVTLFADNLLGSYLKRIEEAYYKGPDSMLSELQDLEEGGIFNTIGIKNFLEADYFAWYLDEWDSEVASLIHDMVKGLLDYEPATVELTPERVRDLFKRLYQNLVPRDIRHRLGEYFTPDWLAELLLDEVGYYGESDKSLLDPACGSGTFLVLAIKRIKELAEEKFFDKRILLERIVKNIKGIDLNPLAVQASKANYLIALSGLLRYRPREGFEIPVYLADSIFVSKKKTVENEVEVYLKTPQGEFWIPHEVIGKNELAHVLGLIENCVRDKYTEKEFETLLNKKVTLQTPSINSILRLYNKILKLEKGGRNRIWVRLLKNSFAPLLIGKFDFVVGNPPWITWENLPQFYREDTKYLWDDYGLLEKTKGMGLGKVKRDMAMMFTARCLDRYVKDDGRYAFLVPFTVFKTQAGGGFRGFLAEGKVITHDHKIPCKLVRVHDLVELYPFEGAVNRTAMFVIEKTGKTEFPIPCTMWHNPATKSMPMNAGLLEVEKITRQFEMILAPVEKGKPRTPWMIVPRKTYDILQGLMKPSLYEAHAGVCTWADGIYWIDIISKEPSGVLVSNVGKTAKTKTRRITKVVDEKFVYPVIRGKDIKKWYAKDRGSILLPISSEGKILSEEKLKTEFANTYSYFQDFSDELRKRSGYKLFYERSNKPFYSVLRAEYGCKPYKVVWKHISGKISGKALLECAVISIRETPVIPTHGVIMIACQSNDEAHYVCSILNSSVALLTVMAYSLEVHLTTDIPQKVNIPLYNPQNKAHHSLSELSKKAHEMVQKIHEEKRTDLEVDLMGVEEEIDETVAELYGITDKEFKEIKKALMILREGEMPEEEEEETGAIVLPTAEPVSIRVKPLLVEERNPFEVQVAIINNTDDGIRNVELTGYLHDDKIGEHSIKKVKAFTLEIVSFTLPALAAGEYGLRFSVSYMVGKDKKTFTEERILYVRKVEKKKTEFGKELDDLLR
ncbi:MAG: N-6 DNA methylase [Theionarchaea archaeon]|nr:N-6 DNA methylase [Theionarchaea archaeon]